MAGGRAGAVRSLPSLNDGALDEAATRGWTVVDMKNDWKVVFPVQKE
jgi:hypothetical protein